MAMCTNRDSRRRHGAPPLRRVVEAQEWLEADRRLIDAYRRVPEDPALIESAARLAARTVPE